MCKTCDDKALLDLAIEKRLSFEQSEADQNVIRNIRVPALVPIAATLSKGSVRRVTRLDKDLIAYTRQIAERLGQSAPSYSAMRQNLRRNVKKSQIEAEILEKQRNFTQQDLQIILSNAQVFLSAEEIAQIGQLFNIAGNDLVNLYAEHLSEAYQASLDYAYTSMKLSAAKQNPQAWAAVPAVLQASPTSTYLSQILTQGLATISSKITINHKAQAFKIISEGVRDSKGWMTIARELHKSIGQGALWHWTRLTRTEIGFAYHSAARDRAENAGMQYEKLSISRTACPICKAAEGYYLLGQGPRIPLHPNCRCVWLHYYDLPRGARARGAYTEQQSPRG
ncbi:MAG: hypothetical protein HRU12_03785 [Phaeodactylibacter sp.]|nr:hypothetical protein [Phaeodactylibacter sp.]